MREHLKRNLLLGLAAAAVLAAAIVALASGGGAGNMSGPTSGPRVAAHRELQLAAEYLGLSASAMRQRLRTGESLGEIADDTRGKSAAGLIEALLARREAALAAAGESNNNAAARARRTVTAEVGRTRGLTASLQTAASYLGLSETMLHSELRSGRSLAELAAAQGKSGSGLIGALTALRVKRLQEALAQREITSAEEQRALGTLHMRVLRLVQRHRLPPHG